MEPPLTFSAQLVEKSVQGTLFDGMDGVLDPRRKYWSNLTIPFQTGIIKNMIKMMSNEYKPGPSYYSVLYVHVKLCGKACRGFF